MILELLYKTSEFSSLTYRQMPFLTAPILWNKVSRPFWCSGEMQERAHGDGVQISYDSPEGLEEVLWLTFLRDKIVDEHVLHPVEAEDLFEEFIDAFTSLTQRLVYLDLEQGKSSARRYLSKNNANFSRLSAIRSVFPEAIILIPFRNPATHVRSQINQHQRFSTEHS